MQIGDNVDIKCKICSFLGSGSYGKVYKIKINKKYYALKISENEIRVTPTENPKNISTPETKINMDIKKIIFYAIAIVGTSVVFGAGIMLFIRRRSIWRTNGLESAEETETMYKILENKIKRKI